MGSIGSFEPINFLEVEVKLIVILKDPYKNVQGSKLKIFRRTLEPIN